MPTPHKILTKGYGERAFLRATDYLTPLAYAPFPGTMVKSPPLCL